MKALAIIVMAGCGGSAGVVDAGPDARPLVADGAVPDATPDAASCASLAAAWQAGVAAAGVACAIDDDCIVVGGPGYPCDADPHISADCGGDPVNRDAYEAASGTLWPLAAEWGMRGCDAEFPVADCPTNDVRCEASLCVVVPRCECLCLHECQDGVDNDGDGTTDFPAECGCTSLEDGDEIDPLPGECCDGVDNDGDGATDYPADAQCLFASDALESG